MFSDFSSPVVSFNSCWETERTSENKEVQTECIEQKAEGVQIVTTVDSEVQTELSNAPSSASIDYDKLSQWLSAITPHVLKELDKSNKSRAFDDYEPGSGDANVILKHLFTLKAPRLDFEPKVSSLSWSCTGSVVAVGLCAVQHPDWCNHASTVTLYNVNRHDFSPNQPTETLHMSSCVTSLAAHPSEAYIIVCGTFNGEVTVWSLQQKEPAILGSQSVHREAVTCSQWVRGADSKVASPLLVTAALDGLVLLWTVGSRAGSIKLHKCFLLQSDKADVDIGVVSLSFNSSDATRFVVAAEGGAILYCTTLGGRPVASLQRAKLPPEVKEIVNPIVMSFESHVGEVNFVEWLPDQKDCFMSCGTDRELRVYNVSQTKPIQVTYLNEPALGISIVSSPVVAHARLVVAWGASGVQAYDPKSGKRVTDLDVGDSTDTVPLTSVAFNSKSSHILAVGNLRGRVKVWQAPFYKIVKTTKGSIT